ncbi:Methyltransferase domain-containing protein [Salipiger thiooxidans]|uniref:Methyltransferase domain-containing protein n=1 Tax=Salipiger thiooxidans TaxID=282683 RepID=A0A1G7KIS4_9RHOB|nr:class I SAM-dependent methyltransferase [Salipiger thiooxidans]SDF36870.1 Methyltransferase domain-containing protein [Salipiger thiooxidans]
MTDDETQRVYAEKALDYEKLQPDDPFPSLRAFIARLPEGAEVLDLGCGPGHDSQHMARAGLRVDALDASPEMIRLANARPGVTARLGTFDDLDAQDRYDGIWAAFSLLHAPRDAIPRHLAAIARALRPGGVLGLMLKEGTGEARDRLGRFYTYYAEPELRALLAEAGLTVDGLSRGEGRGLDGSPSQWISVAAHA